MKEVFAIVAALLAVAGNTPYLYQMIRGTVRPHPYTWLVGSIVSGTVLFGMLSKGAGIGVLPIAVAEVFTIVIFLFSLKFGFVGASRTDRLFLLFALLGLLPWIVTKDATLSVVIAVCVDLLSLVPTFRKTWHHPKTETPTLYGANTIRHMLLLASLANYNIATTLHSLAMIVTNTGMIGIITLRRAAKKYG